MSTTSPNPYLSNIVDHVVKCESLGSLSFVLKESALKLAAVLIAVLPLGAMLPSPTLRQSWQGSVNEGGLVEHCEDLEMQCCVGHLLWLDQTQRRRMSSEESGWSSVNEEESVWENQPCGIVDKGVFKEGREHKEHTNSRPNVHRLNSKALSNINQISAQESTKSQMIF